MQFCKKHPTLSLGMNYYLKLPILVFKFWFLEAPLSLLSYFLTLNKTLNQLLSLTLLFRTFFKPWKNEYRKGLVGVSILMGIFVKSCMILADLLFFLLVIIVEIFFTIGFIVLPILALVLLFVNI